MAWLGIKPQRVEWQSKRFARYDAVAEDLKARGFSIEFSPISLFEASGIYDAVFSISVMEHIPEPDQEAAWKKLASLVSPGGLLFVTVDYGPSDRDWMHDDARFTKPDASFIEKVSTWLIECDIKTTPIDPTFHAANVFDYTFFRILGSRTA